MKKMIPAAVTVLVLAVVLLTCCYDFNNPVDPKADNYQGYEIYKEGSIFMISVVGGSFDMGDTWGIGADNEKPTHNVTLSSFLLGETEVTYAQWGEVYDWAVSNGYHFTNPGQAGDDGIPSDDINEPVTMVSWRDVIVWCNAASEYHDRTPVYTHNGNDIKDSSDTNACDAADCNWSGNGYRLPTEAEWEYAAKGGNNDTDDGQYAGSSNLDDVAWYDANSGSDTHEVKTKDPNELGLYDMSGNVWEWCWDWYVDYTSSPQINPVGPESGVYRVRRGGCWYDLPGSMYSSTRRTLDPSSEDCGFGFRVCRTAD